MKKLLLALGCVSLFIIKGNAQPAEYHSGQIYLALKKLNVLGSVLYIAAHPDDENTRLLTYLSKDRLYRTGYLSVTRGDGGQNLIGDEQGIDLGLIRTQELLAARRIDGAEQFFTRAYDFGYSKTPEETFSKWDKEQVLADVVWVIRNFKPDVVITRFPTTGEGGHGHHTASAILANEAFAAAADPRRFPEQLKHTTPWQVKRVLWNTFNFGGNNTTSPDQLKLDVGGYNAILGKSYGEVAAESRSQHKSQGFGVPRTRGEALEFFKTTSGEAPSSDLFDGVTTSWKRVQGGEPVEAAINQVISRFDFQHPEKSVPELVGLYKKIASLPESYWRRQKLEEVKDIIAAASGLWMEAFATQAYAVQGDSLKVNFVVNDRSGNNIQLKKVQVTTLGDSLTNSLLPSNKNLSWSQTFAMAPNYPLTQPYWLQAPMKEGYYMVAAQQKIGQPDADAAFSAVFTINIEGQDLLFETPVRYKYNDPVRGEVYQPLYVVPPVTLQTDPEIMLASKEKNKRAMELRVQAQKPLKAKAKVVLMAGAYSKVHDDAMIDLGKAGGKTYNFHIEEAMLANGVKELQGSLELPGFDSPLQMAMREINYDHIPAQRYFYRDGVKLLNIDLKTAGKKIGYIPGAGDKVPEALEEMGYEVTLLHEKEIARNNLKQFDAIITGVRAHNTNDWLNTWHQKLMQYVEDGGNLIVQYNTSNMLGPVRSRIGPYDFDIVRNRITDENAAVQFLVPGHPALLYPNKITQQDFEGWVQERSIYHAARFDKPFQAILSMADPGEQPDNGSLIIAPHGKGFFTYTGLVFFRQLPAGVPGAYRLLANLIALNQKKTM